jgi:phosphatidylglycerophosphate synthase
MLDRYTTEFIKPGVEAAARSLHRRGVSADSLTLMGFGLGLGAAGAIVFSPGNGPMWLALALLLASRALDALDGAVARLSAPTDAGGYLDITLDFLFYASIPLAFALQAPAANAMPAALLLAAFIGTGSSFLAFAALAAKRGMSSTAQTCKSFYFLSGLTEATETLIAFSAMCLWPKHFALIACVFAALCAVTIATRVIGGYSSLR